MPSQTRILGETATLKKRKRGPQEDGAHTSKRLRSKSELQINTGQSSTCTHKVNGLTSHAAEDEYDQPGNELVVHPQTNGALAPLEDAGSQDGLVKSSVEESSSWKVSKPMGGRMLDIDPIFSSDERYLIVTYNNSIQVYSTADSLLVRRIPLPITDLPTEWEPEAQLVARHIVSSVLSRTSPEFVWVACSDGRIWRIDWTSGAGADAPYTIETKRLLDLTVDSFKLGDTMDDLVLVLVRRLRRSSGEILAYNTKALAKQAGVSIYPFDGRPQTVRSTQGGRVIVVADTEKLHIGSLVANGGGDTVRTLGDLSYGFYSFAVRELITCLDLRTPDLRPSRPAQKSPSARPIDVAIGCANGAVFLYQNLPATGSASSVATIKQPVTYHWHRRAAFTVKFSKDGSYLVSGGSEEVLVLWQMDTHKCQFYQIGGTIENVTVSPSGSSYALHLDNNSAMVLSTAEMVPTTYVTGINSLVLVTRPSKNSMVKRTWKETDEISRPLVAATHPLDPSRLLLCVGRGQQTTLGGECPSTPMVQTFDLSVFQTLASHAVARTFPTSANNSKDGYPIVEPTVTELSLSHDGKWLATVDEWQPPERDVQDILSGSKSATEASAQRRETHLKIWAVKSDSTSFELVTRVNEPHRLDQGGSTVFDVVADPKSNRFASLGNDGLVRFWSSRLRRRDGLTATGPDGEPLRTWVCSAVVSIPPYGRQQDVVLMSEDASADQEPPHNGALAFSEDGSVLFAALGGRNSSSETAVVAIDTETAAPRDVMAGMCRGHVRAIRVLGSCLVMLSDVLTVYDMVADELLYSYNFKHIGSGEKSSEKPAARAARMRLALLAANSASRSFAVAVPVSTSPTGSASLKFGVKSELVVFSVDDPEPRLMRTFSHLITSVLPATKTSGFTVIDSTAQVWSITEGPEQTAVMRPLAETNLLGPEQEEEGMGMNGQLTRAEDENEEDADSDSEMRDATDADGDDPMEDDMHAAVVAPQKLAEIFDAAPAFAMPPMEDLFYRLAGLFSAKPMRS